MPDESSWALNEWWQGTRRRSVQSSERLSVSLLLIKPRYAIRDLSLSLCGNQSINEDIRILSTSIPIARAERHRRKAVVVVVVVIVAGSRLETSSTRVRVQQNTNRWQRLATAIPTTNNPKPKPCLASNCRREVSADGCVGRRWWWWWSGLGWLGYTTASERQNADGRDDAAFATH